MNKHPNIVASFFIICLLFVMVSCNQDSVGNDSASKVKEDLEKKRAELNEVKNQIQNLEKELETIDPDFSKKQKAKKARLVSTQPIATQNFEKFTEFQASVETKNEFMASSEIGGVLSSLKVKEGQRVKKGQLIGKVDAEIIRRNLDELDVSLSLARDMVIKRQQLVGDDKTSLQKSLDELEVSLQLARSMVGKRQEFIQNDKSSLQRSLDELDVSLALAKDMVNKRKKLIERDNESMQKSLEELSPALTLAKDVYERRKRLWDQNIGSEIEFIKSKNDVESLEKKIETIKSQIAKANSGQDIELESAVKQVESLEKKRATLQAQIAKAGTGNDMELLAARNQVESLEKKKATLQAQITKAGTGHDIELETARNQVESLEKKRATLEAQLNKTNVYSPTSGVIDRIMIKQGEMAGPGVPILRIINTSELQVVADLPEIYLATVKKGAPVTVSIPVLDIEREAKITNIGELIDPSNRTVKVEVALSNRDGKLKPNLMAMLQLKEFTEAEAIVVPTNYIQSDGETYYVFVTEVKEGNQIARLTYVKTGESSGGLTHIKEGLLGDEQLITEGARMVSDGEMIKVLN